MVLFYAVAAPTFTLLIRYVALHRFEGAPGLALGDIALLRPLLIAASVVGVIFAVAGVLVYPTTPMALQRQRVRAPHGIEHITRHPFFFGVGLTAVAHLLLATHLVGTAFFGLLALFVTVGAWHQDRKLLRLRGGPYADYLARTSALPLGAVLAGRQRLVWRELPLGALGVGLLGAYLLRSVHDGIFAAGGAWVIAVTVGGAVVLGIDAWRRDRRAAATGKGTDVESPARRLGEGAPGATGSSGITDAAAPR